MTDQNIFNFQGETAKKTFAITDDDGNELDLTIANINTVNLTVSTGTSKYGEIQFEKTQHSIQNTNEAVFQLQASDTNDLRPGNYLYEIRVDFDNSENYIAEVGTFFIKPKVQQ